MNDITASASNRPNPRGFTLLEILLAVFIFGIVMTTLFGSFNAIFGTVEEIDQKTSQHEMIKTTLDRLSRDLTSLYLTHSSLYSYNPDKEKQDLYRIWGNTRNVDNHTFSFLRFTSYAHLSFENNPQNGIAQIIYYVQPAGKGRYVLKRADSLYPYKAAENYDFEDNVVDPVLCKNIQSFSILYVDENGEEYETWDSESEEFGYGTPRAVKIDMVLEYNDQTLDAGTMVLLPSFRVKKEFW